MKRGFFKRALAVVLCFALLDISNLTTLATKESTSEKATLTVSTGNAEEVSTEDGGNVSEKNSVSGGDAKQPVKIALTINHYLGNEVEADGANMLFAPMSLTVKNGDSVQVVREEEAYKVTGVTMDDKSVDVAPDGRLQLETDASEAVINVFYEKTEGTYRNDTSMVDYDNGSGGDKIWWGGWPTANNSINYLGNYENADTAGNANRIATIGARDDYVTLIEVKDGDQTYHFNINDYFRYNYTYNQHTKSWEKGDKDYRGSFPILKGLLKGLSKSEGSSVYDVVEFHYDDPGFFRNDAKRGKRVLEGYSLEFNRTGMEYELQKVWKEDSVVCDNLSSFFPVGSEYFGMRHDFTFSTGDYIGDMVYSFVGDDDLWVCLDGEVILDLGGIHDAYPTEYNKVPYAPGEVDIWSVLLGKTDYSVQDKIDYVSNPDYADAEHTVTVLFMERGGNQSNCHMKFVMPNVVAEPPVVTSAACLQLQKVDAADNTPLEQVSFTLTGADYDKTLTTDKNGNVSFGGLLTGSYILTETAPEGYLEAGPWTVTVESDITDKKETAYVASVVDAQNKDIAADGNVYMIANTRVESKLTQDKTAELINWENRTYQINLEASSQTQQVTKAEAIDIVLAIDVSRSMLYPASLNHVGEKKVSELDKKEFYYYIQEPGGWNAVFVIWYANGSWHRMDTSAWDYGKSAEGNAQNAIDVKRTEKYDVFTSTEYTSVLESGGKAENEYDRMHAMKTAVKSFVNSIAEASPESRIGIVIFGGKGSGASADPNCNKQVEGLTILNEAGLNTLEKDIDAIQVSERGNTYQQKGLELANALIQTGTAHKDNKYVVFITDGAPNFTVGKGYGSMAEEVTAYAEQVKESATLMTLGVGIDDVESAKSLMTDIASQSNDNKPYAYNVTEAADMENILQIVGNDILSLVPVTGVTIVDSIDGHFDVTDAEGNLLSEGSAIPDKCGNAGVLRKDSAGNWYVEWNDVTIANSVNGTTGWAAEIYVKAKESFLGGNMIPTNGPDSGLRVNDTYVPFDRPTVNVRLLDISLDSKEVTLFKGEEITPAAYMKEIRETLKSEYNITLPALSEEQAAKLIADKTLTVDDAYEGVKTGSFTYTLKSTDDWKSHKASQVGDKVERYQMKVTFTADSLETRMALLEGCETPNTTEGTESFDGVEVDFVATKDTEGVYVVNVVAGSLAVTKKIDAEDIIPEQGDPVFTFKVSKDGAFFCYQTVRFDSAEEEKVVMRLTDLEKGVYTVEELGTLRYEPESSLAEGIGANPAAVADKNVAVFGVGRSQESEKTVLDARDGRVTFVNKKVNDHNFSHADVVVNAFVIGEDGQISWKADSLKSN